MSSPLNSSASEYNSALDDTLNSLGTPEKLNSSLTDSDLENVNLSVEWNNFKSPPGMRRKQQDIRQSSKLLLDNLKNNNSIPGSPLHSTANDETLLDSSATLSALSMDASIGSGGGSDGNSATVSINSSSGSSPLSAFVSDEDMSGSENYSSTKVYRAPTPGNVSFVTSTTETTSESQNDLSVTAAQETSTNTKDSQETTHNVSQLPADGDDIGDENEAMTPEVEADQDISKDESIPVYGSLEEFDKHLPETVTLLRTPEGSRVYLVGTAHFSESSQRDVSLVMRNARPSVVMLELCPSRVHILKYDEKTLIEEAKNINLAKIRAVMRTNGTINGLLYVLLLNMSAKITAKLGMAPGGEFRRAVDEAARLRNCVIHLGDRQINITLQRALRGLSLWQTIKLVPKLLLIDDDITVEEIEQCKKKDLLENIMLELSGEFPAFSRVFLQERDLYLCHSLQLAAMPQPPKQQTGGGSESSALVAPPVTVVGVVGIGHAAGIIKHWGKVRREEVATLVSIPPVSASHRAARFAIKYGTLGLCAWGLFRLARPRLARWF